MKIRIKNILKPIIKDFIFNSIMVEAEFFWFFDFFFKQGRHTKIFNQQVLNFSNQNIFYFINIVKCKIYIYKKLWKIKIYKGTKTTFDFFQYENSYSLM